MPIYEVHHSYPLTHEHKQGLATAICKLHCTAFTTPSFFVHTIFKSHDASDCSYFVAGQARETCTNRIVAQVRTSAKRSRADFDALAEKIETAWYDELKGGPVDDDEKSKNKGKRPGEVDESEREAEAKRLLMITFYPMIAAREAGMTIPEAGDEAAFFKEQMPYMRRMADEKGLEDFKDMLQELEEREDLKKLVS